MWLISTYFFFSLERNGTEEKKKHYNIVNYVIFILHLPSLERYISVIKNSKKIVCACVYSVPFHKKSNWKSTNRHALTNLLENWIQKCCREFIRQLRKSLNAWTYLSFCPLESQRILAKNATESYNKVWCVMANWFWRQKFTRWIQHW